MPGKLLIILQNPSLLSWPALLVLLRNEVLSPWMIFLSPPCYKMEYCLLCASHRPVLSCLVFASIVSPLTCLIHGSTRVPSAMPGNEWLDYTDPSLLGQWRRYQRQVAKVLKLKFLGYRGLFPPPSNSELCLCNQVSCQLLGHLIGYGFSFSSFEEGSLAKL